MLAIGVTQGTASIRAASERLAKMAEQLDGKRWECIVAIPDALLLRLGVFEAGRPGVQPARPFLTFNAFARAEVVEVVRQRFIVDMVQNERAPSMLPVMTVAAHAARQVWVRRLEHNGGDVAFAPLSLRYLLRKQRKGLDLRTGVATGAMLGAVKSGRIIVRKVR